MKHLNNIAVTLYLINLPFSIICAASSGTLETSRLPVATFIISFIHNVSSHDLNSNSVLSKYENDF